MLTDKCAVITGSTSGIGLGIARALAGQGCNIMLNGFGERSKIEKLRSGLGAEFKVMAGYHEADVSKPAEIIQLVEHCTKELGGVDILVNNAGIHVAPVRNFLRKSGMQSSPSICRPAFTRSALSCRR